MLKGYRTIILNVLALILPILELSELAAVLPREWLPWYALALALINMGMRSITTTALGQSK